MSLRSGLGLTACLNLWSSPWSWLYLIQVLNWLSDWRVSGSWTLGLWTWSLWLFWDSWAKRMFNQALACAALTISVRLWYSSRVCWLSRFNNSSPAHWEFFLSRILTWSISIKNSQEIKWTTWSLVLHNNKYEYPSSWYFVLNSIIQVFYIFFKYMHCVRL